VEPAEVTRRKQADEQRAQAERKNMACDAWMESADVCDQQIPNHRIEESPRNVNC
jgi:hypothetical protein